MDRKQKLSGIVIAIVLGAITIALAGLMMLYNTSFKHGNYTLMVNPLELPTMINQSPIDQSDEAEQATNPTYVLYRFGCKDCAAVFDELNQWKLIQDNTYWVSSRSDFGASLIEDFTINEVPAILYWNGHAYEVIYPMQYYTNDTLDTSKLPTADKE